MYLLLKMGIKNIGRNRLRSVLTISAVVLCSGALTVYGIFFAGIMEVFLQEMTHQTGHVRVMHTKLVKDERLAAGRYFVPNVTKLMEQFKKIPNIRGIVPRIQMGGFLDHNNRQAPAQGLGIDPLAEREGWKIHQKIAQGRMIEAKGREILLGKELAERLQAKHGQDITLVGQTVDGSFSAQRLKIVGIMDLGNAVSNKMFIVSLATAQYFLDIQDQATSILLFGSNFWRDRPIATMLRKEKLPAEITVQSWRETPIGAQMLPISQVMIFILGGLIAFIGGIGLLNTLMMSVLERRAEIGLMMALGMTHRRVASIFLIEGLVFGLIGATLGVILSLIGSIPLVTRGISFGSDALSKLPMAMPETLKGSITPESILLGLAVGICATLFGSLWPAYQASKMEPVEALRKT